MKKGSWKRKRGLYPYHTRVREILELIEFRKNKEGLYVASKKNS
jgi:hypothetical protein